MQQVDFLDATGTLFSMANFVNLYVPGFIRPDKTWDRSVFAFSADGGAIVVSALLVETLTHLHQSVWSTQQVCSMVLAGHWLRHFKVCPLVRNRMNLLRGSFTVPTVIVVPATCIPAKCAVAAMYTSI